MSRFTKKVSYFFPLPGLTSILALTARGNSQPEVRGMAELSSQGLVMYYMPFLFCLNSIFCTLSSPKGNIAVIPWTIFVQQGNAISLRENKIVVQEDGYYLVFGQVLSH